MAHDPSLSRREFLGRGLRAAGAATLFSIVPRRVLGGPGYTPPSEELTRAIIGVGGIGLVHLGYDYARLLTICDVDREHLQTGLDQAGPGVRGVHDFREVLADPAIDIVHIATPPHWHGPMSIAAARAGKDIWCEKPMTRTIGEGRKVVEAVRRHGRVFRVNTWFRFKDTFYGMGTPVAPIKKLVDAGVFGWPLRVTLNASTGFEWKFFWQGLPSLAPEPVPSRLDYDLWLGPAPVKPYATHRVHGTFRGYWDYDGGGLGDMGQHYLDPVQYLLGKDETSPIEIEIDAPQQHPDAVSTWRRIEMKYADGCRLILDGENRDTQAPFIEGPKGKLYPGLRSDIAGLERTLAELPDPPAQLTDFGEAVRTRRPFALNELNAHRSATIVNLGKIALQLGRGIRFDPERQECVGDPAANALMNPIMRAPWQI